MVNPLIVVCWLRAVYRSIVTEALVSGHDWEDAGIKTPPNVQVLQCALCNKKDISWSFEPIDK